MKVILPSDADLDDPQDGAWYHPGVEHRMWILDIDGSRYVARGLVDLTEV